MAEPEIRGATVDDAEEVGRILGAAFDDNPIINWIVRTDERRGWAIETLFREVGRYEYLPGGECHITADCTGATLWRAPGVPERNDPRLGAIFEEIVGDNADHSRVLGEVRDAHHPAEEHFYLLGIGVLPGGQGGGVGSALIRTVLDRCDRERIPAYLENSKERNLPFYERHGFVVRERIELPDGGPPLWPMWRNPR